MRPGTNIKTVIIVLAGAILLSLISFILLAKYYPPLNRSLFGEEFLISFDVIQFWVKKVPERNYYRVYAKYKKSPETIAEVEWLDFSHPVFYMDSRKSIGFNAMFFNPEDSKIYGGGSDKDSKEWKWAFYRFGEGKFEEGLFRPVFPEGTKFTFHQRGSLEFTSAPRDHITIYFPSILEKLEKGELEKGILAEIAENEDPTKRRK